MDELHRRLTLHIRDLAEKRQIAITHIPDRAGVSRSHFWDVMKGRKHPTLVWVQRIARALELDAFQLLRALGDPPYAASKSERTRAEKLGPQPLIFRRLEPSDEDKYVTCVPLVALRTAARGVTGTQESRADGWIEPRAKRRLHPGMFASRVAGESMQPKIPDGSVCLFRLMAGEDPSGRIVLVQHPDIRDADTGGHYTLKRFQRRRTRTGPEVRLEPLNPEFAPIILREQTEGLVKVIAEFLEVL